MSSQFYSEWRAIRRVHIASTLRFAWTRPQTKSQLSLGFNLGKVYRRQVLLIEAIENRMSLGFVELVESGHLFRRENNFGSADVRFQLLY